LIFRLLSPLMSLNPRKIANTADANTLLAVKDCILTSMVIINFSSKKFISLLKPSLLLIVMGFSFLWGQTGYTTSQDLTIPPNITKMTVKAWGAGGGGGSSWTSWQRGGTTGGTGGSGGFTQTTINVESGDVYRVLVGQPGGFMNFRDEGGPYSYPRRDSLYYENDFYYGRGGCGPGVDAIGCGSYSRANVFPTRMQAEGYNGWVLYKPPDIVDTYMHGHGEIENGPIGTVLARPSDAIFGTYPPPNGRGPKGHYSPGPAAGSGGQMSGIYKITGSDPQFNILNYVVIAGGGGGGGAYNQQHSNRALANTVPIPSGGSGGGAGGQDGVLSSKNFPAPNTPEDKFIPRGGSGGSGGTSEPWWGYARSLPGLDFSSGGHGGFFNDQPGPSTGYHGAHASQAENGVLWRTTNGSNARDTDGAGGGGGYGGGSGGQNGSYPSQANSGGGGGGGYFDPNGTDSRTEAGTLPRIPPSTDDVDYEVSGSYGYGGSVDGHGIQGYVVVQLGDKPVGTDMSVQTLDSFPVSLKLIANDPETDRASLNYNITTPAQHGTVNEDNKPDYIYTPHTTWTGIDIFKVTITDEQGNNSLPSVIQVNTIARSAKSTITYSSPSPYTGASRIGEQITITATFDEQLLAAADKIPQITLSGEQSIFNKYD
jgi:hypothetical protein